MLKYVVPTGLLIILISVNIGLAHACSCELWSEAQSREALERAFFVGKAQVLSVNDLTDNPNDTSVVELDVIQSYKDDLQGSITAVRNLNEGMCAHHPVEVDEVLEVIIYEIEHDKYHYIFKGQCPVIMPDIMEELRQKGAER